MHSDPSERLAQQPSPPGTKLHKWTVIGVGALLAIGALIYSQQIPDPAPSSPEPRLAITKDRAVSALTAEESQQIERVFHEYQPVKVIPLPKLASSDSTVRKELLDFLTFEEAPKWLETDELIRKNVVAISNLGTGQIAYKHLLIPRPAGKLEVESRDGKLYLSHANYRRFDHITERLASIDIDATLRFYVRYRGLFQQAYNELGAANTPFETAGVGAIDELLATPDVAGELELTQKSVIYKYADPKLEQLSDSQKLLLRIGPDNRHKIKAKLTELRRILLGE